ncbi:hypothetical protein DFH29DRAFT_997458 [Suillus ampliporus]|nr:hypothetical protein DFH29DRAFT_997458 [Suillus ampliporus]
MSPNSYDILIVGAGVADPALAYALATKTCNKHNAPFTDSSTRAFLKLGLELSLREIGAVPLLGYHLLREERDICDAFQGKAVRGFDHGSFAMTLRDRAREAPNVVVIEATVTGLIRDQSAHRVIGVRAFQAGGQPEPHFADIVILADGSSSSSELLSWDLKLLVPKHAIMAVFKGAGPLILFELPNNEHRMLVESKDPPPADLEEHIVCNIVPQLPSSLRSPILKALNTAGLFAADGEAFDIMQEGALKFGKGAEYVDDPISLAAGITHSLLLLAHSCLVVAFYAIWVLFAYPRPGETSAPKFCEYPFLLSKH